MIFPSGSGPKSAPNHRFYLEDDSPDPPQDPPGGGERPPEGRRMARPAGFLTHGRRLPPRALALHVLKLECKLEDPIKFIGFGDIHGPKPYKFIGFGDIHGPKT